MNSIPVCEKAFLTVNEASDYFGICANKLRSMTDTQGCPYVLWNGSKRLIKRQKLENYLNSEYSI